MENIKIEGTERSPFVDFNFQTNTFKLGGMCYAENINDFFKHITDALYQHLAEISNENVVFDFHFSYFNSSSARLIMRMFDKLEAAAEAGNDVSIVWNYDEEDDTMEEQGEEYGEDLVHAQFEKKSFSS